MNSMNIFNKKTIKKIDIKINLLGKDFKLDTENFLMTRLVTSIFFFVLIFAFFEYGYILSIVFIIVYYYAFEYFVLDKKILEREKKLNNEAIYFFEVLTLSLQTGRNLAEAINITVSAVDNDLSKEFLEALKETKYGKSLTECLIDIQKRIPSDIINNVILVLTQANVYGSSIISTLNNQVDYLREKRKLEIKSTIAKIPIKVSVISVLFFIPLILLIIVGPLVVRYLG